MLICWQWDLASKQHATNRWEQALFGVHLMFFFSQKLQTEKNYTAEIYLKKNNIKTRRCTMQWHNESTTKAPELSEGSSTLDFICIVFSLCNLWLKIWTDTKQSLCMPAWGHSMSRCEDSGFTNQKNFYNRYDYGVIRQLLTPSFDKAQHLER